MWELKSKGRKGRRSHIIYMYIKAHILGHIYIYSVLFLVHSFIHSFIHTPLPIHLVKPLSVYRGFASLVDSELDLISILPYLIPPSPTNPHSYPHHTHHYPLIYLSITSPSPSFPPLSPAPPPSPTPHPTSP